MINYVAGKINLNKYVHRIKQSDTSFQVHYWGGLPKHLDTLIHKHSFFEICYVLDGQGIYIEEGKEYRLQKDTMFMSRPNILHQIKSEEGLYIVYVAFELIESESSKEWIKMIERAKVCSQVVIEVDENTVASLLWKSLLIQAMKAEQAFFEEMLNQQSFHLIYSLIQTFAPFSNQGNHNNSPETYSVILNQVKLYIRDNLSDPLKLTDVSNHFHISGRHLSRLFVTELGMSYSDFIQNERVQRAATLLKTTDLSIKDIAEECGFSTVHYFTRVFKSSMRTPPGRFRSIYTNIKDTSFNDHSLNLRVL